MNKVTLEKARETVLVPVGRETVIQLLESWCFEYLNAQMPLYCIMEVLYSSVFDFRVYVS